MVCGGSFQHTVQLESDFKTRLSRFWALRATTNAGGMANRLSATGAVDFPAGLEAFLLRAMRYGGKVASAAVKSPSLPFGFRHAAGHEMRPSPHTNTPLRGYTKATGNVFAPCRWHSYRQHEWLGVVPKQLLHLFATLQLFTNTNGGTQPYIPLFVKPAARAFSRAAKAAFVSVGKRRRRQARCDAAHGAR